MTVTAEPVLPGEGVLPEAEVASLGSEIDWDLHWADVGWVREQFSSLKLDADQRINHFPNHYELTRKDLLVKNLKRKKKQLQKSGDTEEASQYNFWCKTFVLPADYNMFVEEFKKCGDTVWIMKPIGRAQGKGIFLFRKLSEIKEWKKGNKWKQEDSQVQAYIVQRYIENPYTIGGFARFSLSRYCTSKDNIDNLYMHLTNSSVQKTAEDYDKRQGSKWELRSLKLYLYSKHGRKAVEDLFMRMQWMILRSLFAVQQVMMQDKHCFELYGYDVLIDSDLKPWLIEVNASPALTGDTAQDCEMKRKLVQATLDVVDIEGRRTGKEIKVGGFDMIWNNGPVLHPTMLHKASAKNYKALVYSSSHEEGVGREKESEERESEETRGHRGREDESRVTEKQQQQQQQQEIQHRPPQETMEEYEGDWDEGEGYGAEDHEDEGGEEEEFSQACFLGCKLE